jgi:hypothetical protein
MKENNSQKTLLMLGLFLLVIVALQISKMDIFYNNEQYQAPTLPVLQEMGTGVEIENSHQVGKIALLYDPSAIDRDYVLDNFQSLLQKSKLDYDLISVEEERTLEKYPLLIVILARYDRAPILQEVFNCVEKGATAYFPIVPENSDSYISISTSFGLIEKATKISCNSLIDTEGFIGPKGESYVFETPIALRYQVRLRSDCLIYFHDEDKNPLLWSRNLENGKLFVGNCDFLGSYQSRGVIMEVLYRCLKQSKGESLLYPISATATLMLEEFASPYQVETSFMMDSEKLDYEKMMQSRVWPLLTRTMREFHFKPVLSYVLSYDENTEGNFESNQFPINEFKLYASEILRNGGEVAFHGFSMRPLGLEGQLEEIGWFIPWTSYTGMAESLQAAKSPLERIFPNYIISTYMPPQGRIAPGVLEKLPEMDANLKVLALTCRRLYADQLIRDMERDTNIDNLYYYTLFSCFDGLNWTVRNSLLAQGMTSMTLNFDQILENSRMTFPQWSEVFLETARLVATYPGMEHTTIRQAASKMEMTHNSEFSYRETADSIVLNVEKGYLGMRFVLRSQFPILPGEDYTVEKYAADYYVITLQSAHVILQK